jgi:hypothetical protein
MCDGDDFEQWCSFLVKAPATPSSPRAIIRQAVILLPFQGHTIFHFRVSDIDEYLGN